MATQLFRPISTLRVAHVAAPALALILSFDFGCGGRASQGDPSSSGPPGPVGTTPGAARYPGKGFVVHEWGTNTIVVGSDGSLQRGLHHEEEGLPAFVYDRLKAAVVNGGPGPSVEVKMETPVTYFYSDQPLTVKAQVGFPKGVFTQWYPAVTTFEPFVAWRSGPADPALDPSFSFGSQSCRDHYATIANGRLDWGQFDVLARGGDSASAFPTAPLEQYSWSYARQVDANAVRLPSGEAERFLFYRGLGSFDLPLKVTAQSGGRLTMANGYGEAMGSVFVLNVGPTRAAFKLRAEGVGAGASIDDTAPSLDGASDLDTYTGALGEAVTRALDATGLYHDESVAMVNTWKRQWFRTPGIRLLYLIPQSWTDQSIPLTIDPKPESTKRVMLIRVEVISPENEAADANAASMLDGSSTADAGKAYFRALGRFAEPRLRRAIAVVGQAPGAEQYLSTIATANTIVAGGE